MKRHGRDGTEARFRRLIRVQNFTNFVPFDIPNFNGVFCGTTYDAWSHWRGDERSEQSLLCRQLRAVSTTSSTQRRRLIRLCCTADSPNNRINRVPIQRRPFVIILSRDWFSRYVHHEERLRSVAQITKVHVTAGGPGGD
jgi:hypothetical protein